MNNIVFLLTYLPCTHKYRLQKTPSELPTGQTGSSSARPERLLWWTMSPGTSHTHHFISPLGTSPVVISETHTCMRMHLRKLLTPIPTYVFISIY